MYKKTKLHITTFSKEGLIKLTRAASEILDNASRCISTELLPTPDDVDAEVLEIVHLEVSSDTQRLYDRTEESSSLKKLVISNPKRPFRRWSMTIV